jgi:hypothetical protein
MRQQKSRVSPQEPSRRAVPAQRSNPNGGNGRPTHDQISQRAYEIYLSRGTVGDAVADWLQAEQELDKRD